MCLREFHMGFLCFEVSLCTHNSSLEGPTKLTFVHAAPIDIYFCVVSFFAKVKIFIFWPKTMDYIRIVQGF